MNDIQAARVRASFKSFEPCGEAFVARVLLRVQELDPQARSLFPPGSTPMHRVLFATLAQIVRGLDRFSTLEAPLMRLGVEAARRGARGNHYAIVRNALLVTMGELQDADWTPTLARDWELALAGVCGVMQRGALRQAA